MKNKKVILGVIIILVLAVAVFHVLNPCGLVVSEESKEACYIKTALKTNNSNFCSKIETVYRQKRCVELVESTEFSPEQIESVLKNLKNL